MIHSYRPARESRAFLLRAFRLFVPTLFRAHPIIVCEDNDPMRRGYKQGREGQFLVSLSFFSADRFCAVCKNGRPEKVCKRSVLSLFTYQVQVKDENKATQTYEQSYSTYHQAVKELKQKILSFLEQERTVVRQKAKDKNADWALTYTHKYNENDELTNSDVDGLRFLCLDLHHWSDDKFLTPNERYGDIYVDNQNNPLTIYFTILYNGDSELPLIPNDFWY